MTDPYNLCFRFRKVYGTPIYIRRLSFVYLCRCPFGPLFCLRKTLDRSKVSTFEKTQNRLRSGEKRRPTGGDVPGYVETGFSYLTMFIIVIGELETLK